MQNISEFGKSGLDYKEDVIDRFCGYEWPRESLLNLVQVTRDISLTNSQLKKVVEKIIE